MRISTPDGVVEFPDSMPPDSVKAVLRRRYGARPEVSAMGSGTQPQGTPPSIGRALALYPSGGAFIGAELGAPLFPPFGSIAGAAIGGAVGKLGEQAGMRQPVSLGSAAAEGGIQAGLTAGGLGLAYGATRLAGPLMKRALGVLPSLAERFGTTPEEIAKTVIGMRLPVNQRGMAAARSLNKAARIERSAILARTPGTVGPEDIAGAVISDSEKAIGRRLTSTERADLIATVRNEAESILSARTHGAVAAPSRYSMRDVEQIKEVAAQQARPAYRAAREATSVSSNPVLSSQVAAGARARLAQIPGVPSANERVKETMMVEQAIRKALARGKEPMSVDVGIGAPGMRLFPGAKLSPDKLSRAALTLTRPSFQKLIRHSPRAAAALMKEILYQE